jgi:hypothetical protein
MSPSTPGKVFCCSCIGSLSELFKTGRKHLLDVGFTRRNKTFCVSAAYNCSIDCVSPSPSGSVVARACALKTALSAVSQNKPICSDADVLSGRWVKLYWDSDEDCGEGYQSTWAPGIWKEKTCCSGSQQCNAPGATPPTMKCFSTRSSVSAGYCVGKTASFSACAVSQTRADEKSAKSAEVVITTNSLMRFYIV